MHWSWPQLVIMVTYLMVFHQPDASRRHFNARTSDRVCRFLSLKVISALANTLWPTEPGVIGSRYRRQIDGLHSVICDLENPLQLQGFWGSTSEVGSSSIAGRRDQVGGHLQPGGGGAVSGPAGCALKFYIWHFHRFSWLHRLSVLPG